MENSLKLVTVLVYRYFEITNLGFHSGLLGPKPL